MKQYSFLPVVGLFLVIAFGVHAQEASTEDKLSALVTGFNNLVNTYVAGVTKGVYAQIPNNSSLNTSIVNLPRNLQLSAGAVALPLDFLCRQPKDGIVDTLVCHVCSYDCTFVHNKYGGKCGTASNPAPGTPQETGEVCVCNDSAPNSGNFTDLQATCGTMVTPALDAVIDLAVAAAFRVRMFALQCPPITLGLGGRLLGYNSAGCNTDCTFNHNYVNGTCGSTTAVATFPTETAIGFNCVCSH